MFRILIVDDSKSVHAFVTSLLSHSTEINTHSVFDGSEALLVLKDTQHYDLILLDWEMPVLNGPLTFQKILDLHIKIPVIMMTTKNNPDDIIRMLNMGVSEYLMKPFTVDILFEKISLVMGKAIAYAA